MAGPNYVLDKGYLVGGSTAILFGEAVVLGANSKTVIRATSAGANVLGISQENLDVAKVNTGKAAIDVRIMGISRCIAGAAIALGVKVTNDTSARVVTAGAAASASLGVALQAAANAGDQIDVLLTPFNTV